MDDKHVRFLTCVAQERLLTARATSRRRRPFCILDGVNRKNALQLWTTRPKISKNIWLTTLKKWFLQILKSLRLGDSSNHLSILFPCISMNCDINYTNLWEQRSQFSHKKNAVGSPKAGSHDPGALGTLPRRGVGDLPDLEDFLTAGVSFGVVGNGWKWWLSWYQDSKPAISIYMTIYDSICKKKCHEISRSVLAQYQSTRIYKLSRVCLFFRCPIPSPIIPNNKAVC